MIVAFFTDGFTTGDKFIPWMSKNKGFVIVISIVIGSFVQAVDWEKYVFTKRSDDVEIGL